MTGLRAFQSQGGAEGVFELADPSPEPDFQRAPVRRPHLEAPLVKHLPLAAKTVGFLETPTGVNLLSGAEVPNSWCSPRFHDVMTYQPASRNWPFQAYETALFVLIAPALAGVSFWWVRRRFT